MTESRKRTYLIDYREPDFRVRHIELDMDLGEHRTIVRTRLHVLPNEAVPRDARRLELDGDGLEVLSLLADRRTLYPHEYIYANGKLAFPQIKDAVVLDIVTAVVPRENTSALGLHLTNDGELFSQCESEGFRRFAFAVDRPDVLSTFDVVLRGDKKVYPTMLSNGHLVAGGDLPNGRHWVRWHDPGPKPTYLFAIFAGDLVSERRTFVTRSGKPVEVGLYAPKQYFEVSRPTMEFVLAAMKWDEETFDREYDLATFNVGVMNGFPGAMENKGLNLFDLAWFVTSDTNTTDEEYEYRLKSVAHEYFHHWSGDRVTVKNWFQVSLKEGLTRFRDQLFLADRTEFAAVRIRMARHLRANQFTEDDSSTAHAPILESYIEPLNVYTNTVYDKGQEAVFMLMAMLGRERFCKATAVYFDRYADQAVTIEEFLSTFEDVAGLDLTQFRLWYYQAGLTDVFLRSEYDANEKRFVVHLEQRTRPTIGQPKKKAHHIPFAIGLLDSSGSEMEARLEGEERARPAGTLTLDFCRSKQTFVFEDVTSRPVLSRLRGFSAPVRLNEDVSDDDLAFLLQNDTDMFARWDAAQSYASLVIARLAEDHRLGRPMKSDEQFLAAFTAALGDERLSPRMKADMISLPDERILGQATTIVDVDGVHAGRVALAADIASYAKDRLFEAVHATQGACANDRGNESVGLRYLKAVTLDYLTRIADSEPRRICLEILRSSKNFSEQVGVLTALAERDCSERGEALGIFKERNRHDPLAYNQWYRVQAMAAREDTPDVVDTLMEAPDFEILVSRLYTLSDAFFAHNRYGVNAPGGRGYKVFAKQILRIDSIVPMMASWVLARSDMRRWFKFDSARRTSMRATLETMLITPGISEGLYEHCSASLNADEGREIEREATGARRRALSSDREQVFVEAASKDQFDKRRT